LIRLNWKRRHCIEKYWHGRDIVNPHYEECNALLGPDSSPRNSEFGKNFGTAILDSSRWPEVGSRVSNWVRSVLTEREGCQLKAVSLRSLNRWRAAVCTFRNGAESLMIEAMSIGVPEFGVCRPPEGSLLPYLSHVYDKMAFLCLDLKDILWYACKSVTVNGYVSL